MVVYTEEQLRQLQEQKMIIYMVTNLINNKKYIGLTTNTFNIRYGAPGVGSERMFKYYSYKGNSMNEHLFNSMKKYGIENFKVEIIDCAEDDEELKEKEKFWISFYNACDDRYGYNVSEGGDLSVGNLWRFEQYKRNTSLQWYDTSFFEKLIEENYGNEKICNELFRDEIIVVKNRVKDGKKIKEYYYYKSIYSCFFSEQFKQSIHDMFVMCKRNEGIKEEWTKIKYFDKYENNIEYYFTKDIMIPQDVLFENIGEGAKIKNAKARKKIRERRQREIERKKMKKYMNKTRTKKCQNCGREIKGCQYCADCKAKKEFERQKQKAIQEGRTIKICPICGKEHWRLDRETCSDKRCYKKYYKN